MNLGGGTTFLMIAFLIIFLAVRACRYGAGQRFRMKTASSDSVNRANSSVSGLRFLVSLSDGCWCWLISCFISFFFLTFYHPLSVCRTKDSVPFAWILSFIIIPVPVARIIHLPTSRGFLCETSVFPPNAGIRYFPA